MKINTMKQQTYTAGKDLILHDGEIYILDNDCEIEDCYVTTNYDYSVFFQDGWYGKQPAISKITHSTASLDGVIKLDRRKFVKPVDIEALAKQQFDGFDDAFKLEAAFIAGHNVKECVYTRADVVAILNNAYKKKALSNTDIDIFINEVIDEYTPLSLPSSVTLTDNKITEVKWKDI